MTIKSTQTIIKIGSSAGVTIPAKDLKRAGLSVGREVRIIVEPLQDTNSHQVTVVDLTQKLIARHQQALQNLSLR